MSATVGGSMTNTELSGESTTFLKALWSKLDHGLPDGWEFRQTEESVLTYKDADGNEHKISGGCWGGSIDVDRPISLVNPDLDPVEDIAEILALSFNHWIKKIIASVTETDKSPGGLVYFRLHRGLRFEYYLHSFIHTEVIDLPLQTPQMIGGADIRAIKRPYTEDTPELSHPSPIVPPARRYTAFMDVAFVPTWD